MNRALLAYMVSIGTLTSLLLFLVGGMEQGEALALGMALGVSVLIGYPLGRAGARLLIAGELRLLESNLARASEIAAEHRIPLPSAEEIRGRKPPLSAWVAVAGIGAGAALAPVFAVLSAMSVILAMSGLPAGGFAAAAVAVGGAGAFGFALASLVTLYYRGRIEHVAFRLSVARGAGQIREKGRSVERALRIGGAERRYA